MIPRRSKLLSLSLTASDERVLDASQIVGPDALADILDFLGVDQDFLVQHVPGGAADDGRHLEGGV
jgi:hypothetical protein